MAKFDMGEFAKTLQTSPSGLSQSEKGEVRERSIEDITGEILHLKEDAGNAIISIGQRLIEAKSMLPHGAWLPWLTEQVEFSERTATRFMRLAREWSNQTALSDLGATKALTLLALPAEEREIFMEQNHLVDGEDKNVIDMSARELEQAIRDRDEAAKARESALAEKQAAEQARDKMAEDMKVANERLASAQSELDSAADREAELRESLSELKKRPIEVTGAAVPDEKALAVARSEGASAARKEAEQKLQEKIKKAEETKKAAQEKLLSLQESLKAAQDEAAKEAGLLRDRVASLEKQVRLSGNKEMAAFSIYFSSIQEDFNRLLGCLQKMVNAGNAAEHDKLVDAMQELLKTLSGSVPQKVGGEND